MRLNLHILKTDLDDVVIESRIVDDLLICRLNFAVSYRGETQLLDDRLYLALASDLPENMKFDTSPSLMCIGTPPGAYLEGDCNILVLQENLELDELFSRVNEKFYTYNDWENQLRQILATGASLETLGRLAVSVFLNPIAMIESNLNIIFAIIDSKLFSLPKNYLDSLPCNQHYSPNQELREINSMRHDNAYIEASQMKGPAFFPADICGYRALYQNLFLSGTDHYSCRIVVDEVSSPLTEKHAVLLDFFSQIAAQALRMKESVLIVKPKYFDEVLTDLLNHNFLPDDKIIDLLTEMHWNVNDTYFCVTIPPADVDELGHTIGCLASSLALTIPSNCYMVYKKNIVFILNLSNIQKSKAEVLKILLPTLRDSQLIAGISAEFHVFKNLYYYYNQCLIALRLGAKEASPKWFYHFEDYELEYLRGQCTKLLIPEALYPKGVLRLMKHDAKTGSCYVDILRTYLACNMSPLKTREKLFMHRNTFTYRLNRMLEILNMDLENAENRLLLQIVLSLYK